MSKGTGRNWPPHQDLLRVLKDHGGSVNATASTLDIPEPTLSAHVNRHPELKTGLAQIRAEARPVVVPEDGPDPLPAQVRKLIARKRTLTVEHLADELDMSPRRIRECLDHLRDAGYRVPPEKAGQAITLERLNPAAPGLLHKSLLQGNTVRFAVVSDTHLASNEEALGELHLAYDVIQEAGITEVYHPGDLVAGRGIFRTQDAEVKVNTFERQVDYAVEHYPRRDGVQTYIIGGNHDLEGDFGKIGADPVQAVANRRDDFTYLGPFNAWVELPGGAFVHMVHGKGGGSYALSYKIQRFVEGYGAGRKPAILLMGHFHVHGHFEVRGVQALFPGCFEWQTPLLQRLGLQPAVGFHLCTVTIGDDGSVVKFVAEWNRFWEGRTVRRAA